MQPAFFLFLFSSGAIVGFFSGLLGIGGGILMFPLLLYMPAAFGFDPVAVKDITGLTMVQGFFASLSAMFFYQRERLVNRSLVFVFGSSLFLSSLSGALVSKNVSDGLLLFIFAALAFTASIFMFIPRSYQADDITEERVTFNRTMAAAVGVLVGFLIGLVGQGGAFIIIPILLYVLKIPFRVAIGSTLAIGLFSATAGLMGKGVTGQVPYQMAAALLAGAIPAAHVGGIVGRKTRVEFLRWILAFIITASAVKVMMDIF